MSRFVIHEANNGGNDLGWGWVGIADSYHLTSVIQKIPDNSVSNKGKIGTSIPTPLARIELFETAFGILHGAAKENKEGDVDPSYKRLVSDCLDMLQLIFEKGTSEDLKVEVWDIENGVSELVNGKPGKGKFPGHQLIGRALKSAFGREDMKGENNLVVNNKFQPLSEIYIFSYKDIILGGSSPYTLVYTAPNLWHNIQTALNERKVGISDFISDNGRVFFKDEATAVPMLIEGRSDTFKEYLRSLAAVIPENNFRDYICKELGERNESLKANFGNKFKPLKPINFEFTPICYNNAPIDTSNSGLRMRPNKQVKLYEDLPGYRELFENKVPLVLCEGKGTEFFYLKQGEYWNRNTSVSPSKTDSIVQRKLPTNGTHATSQNQYPYVWINDFLEECIVNIDYDINEDKFVSCSKKFIQSSKDGRSRYLLPIKKEFFLFYTLEDLKNLMVFKEDYDGVQVTLRIPVVGNTGQEDCYIEFERKYSDAGDYRILKYSSDNESLMSISVFPFYRIKEDKALKAEEEPKNQYIVQFCQSCVNSKSLKVNGLKFYSFDAIPTNEALLLREDKKKGDEENKEEELGFRSVKIRTTDKGAVSSYYHLQSINESNRFDLIEMEFDGNSGYKALVIPCWGEEIDVKLGSEDFVFAVDFGTSNTHVACSSKGGANPQPLSIDKQVATLAYNLKDTSILKNKFLREFIPATGVYPLKTSSLETPAFANSNETKFELFSEINIGYILEDELVDIDQGKYRYMTDLKWAYQQDREDRIAMNRVNAFCKQTVWMMRNKLLMNGGRADTSLIYFTPSCMIDDVKIAFKEAWNNSVRSIMRGFPQCKILEIDEAVAPYYALLMSDSQVTEASNIVNIDIGGGTTDIFYFDCRGSKKMGYIASSMFAGNDIWGNGVRKGNDIKNGIVRKAMKKMEATVPNSFRPFFDNCKKFSSADASSMLFKYDKELGYSTILENDNEVRSLLLVHYASILYYICDLLSKYELEIPRYISFTGKGSEYLKLFARDINRIEKITRALLKTFIKKDHDRIDKLSIIRVENPKELTANGGVQHDQTVGRSDFEIYNDGHPICTSGTGRKEEGKYRNSHVVNDRELKEAVLSNFNQFIHDLYDSEKLQDALRGSGLTFAENDKLSKKIWAEKAVDSYEQTQKWFQAQTEKQQAAEIDSTVFFFALKDAIFQLSQIVTAD